MTNDNTKGVMDVVEPSAFLRVARISGQVTGVFLPSQDPELRTESLHPLYTADQFAEREAALLARIDELDALAHQANVAALELALERDQLRQQSEVLTTALRDTRDLWHASEGECERLRHQLAEAQEYKRDAERNQKRLEILSMERHHWLARFDRLAVLLSGIHSLLYPAPITANDGRVMVFRPKSIDPHEILQELSDRIRALPDELAAIASQKEQT